MSAAGLIKELREKTGAGMLDCKVALEECNNDMEKAAEFLRKKGILKAEKRMGRSAGEGVIHSYIHSGGKIGVLVEVNCETDFVAKTDDFKSFAHEIALQVAAANPGYVTKDEVPEDALEKERGVLRAQAEASGKTGPVVDKIVEGKLRKYFEENCLMHQTYVKDSDKNIETLLKETIAKLGENISVRRFTRFQLGDA